VIVTVDLDQLAELAGLEAESHPPRTPGRRAAAHLFVALTVPPAKSIASARNAIATFGDERTQSASLDLLYRLAASVPSNPPERQAS
jgi:hypothetical protein